MSGPGAVNQDDAYEHAVLSARSDPAMRDLVRDAFLDADAVAALKRFRTSEHWVRVRRLLEETCVQPPARVLDLGGGRGLIAASLAMDGYRATLCEVNESAVCGAGAAPEVRSAAGRHFDVATQMADLPPGRFDAIVCRAVLHHMDPLVGVLAEALTLLRPDGALIAGDEPTVRSDRGLRALRREHPFVRFGVEENAFRVREYRRALKDAGFADVRARFPVSWTDYRSHVRPELGGAHALSRYGVYRLRSLVRPEPGAVRTFTARRPQHER